MWLAGSLRLFRHTPLKHTPFALTKRLYFGMRFISALGDCVFSRVFCLEGLWNNLRRRSVAMWSGLPYRVGPACFGWRIFVSNMDSLSTSIHNTSLGFSTIAKRKLAFDFDLFWSFGQEIHQIHRYKIGRIFLLPWFKFPTGTVGGDAVSKKLSLLRSFLRGLNTFWALTRLLKESFIWKKASIAFRIMHGNTSFLKPFCLLRILSWWVGTQERVPCSTVIMPVGWGDQKIPRLDTPEV